MSESQYHVEFDALSVFLLLSFTDETLGPKIVYDVYTM